MSEPATGVAARNVPDWGPRYPAFGRGSERGKARDSAFPEPTIRRNGGARGHFGKQFRLR